MKVIKKLKGGSLSETLVVEKGNSKIVRKFICSEHEREYGFVRWHSQLRKIQLLNSHLPKYNLPIYDIGIIEGKYFYDMPYIEGSLNGYEYLINNLDQDILKSSLSDFFESMDAISYPSVPNEFLLYLSEEVTRPLKDSLLNIEEYSFVNTQMIKKIEQAILTVEDLSKKVPADIPSSLCHGNLTLENTLWDPKKNRFYMIDPYAETYGENIFGDLSQLYQSTSSGYDYLNSIDIPEVSSYPYSIIPNQLTNFSRSIDDLVDRFSSVSNCTMLLLRSSQFTRMFPFKKVKAPRHAYLFLLHGIDLIESASKC
jgi:hypothetical protein